MIHFFHVGKSLGILFIGIIINISIKVVLTANTIDKTSINNRELIPFFWMVFIVGGCIAITLSYVSWRKYKGEEKKQKKKDTLND